MAETHSNEDNSFFGVKSPFFNYNQACAAHQKAEAAFKKWQKSGEDIWDVFFHVSNVMEKEREVVFQALALPVHCVIALIEVLAQAIANISKEISETPFSELLGNASPDINAESHYSRL